MLGRIFGNILRGPPDTRAARELVRNGATLLDVRSPAEFASGHVPGAVNIPVQALTRRHHEIRRDAPVVVYCRSGGRSARAAQILAGAGFGEVLDVGPVPDW
ncbi:MAG: rhodanese-like domain-containing protein [bacterium]|nr:rhodanese-like domain-containing protein [bacterium]